MPYAKFEQRAVRDEEASAKEGREILVDQDWVNIIVDQNTQVPKMVDTFLRDNEAKVKDNRMTRQEADHHKASYLAWKEGRDEPLSGTDLRHWSPISKATAENLRNAGIRTVEEFSEAPDNILDHVGMGARKLQGLAKSYLKANDGKAGERFHALEKMAETQKQQISDLIEANKALQEKLNEKPESKDKKASKAA